MTRAVRRIVPRRIDAIHVATTRLVPEPSLRVSLGDAGTATLQMRPATPAAIVPTSGLAVSTRFGRMIWHDYETWLLALTGVDTALAAHRPAREAFVHYALAALPATLGAALGDPQYDASANNPCDSRDSCAANADSFVVSLSCTLLRLSVSMRLRLAADALNRMIDELPWHCPSPGIEPWLASLPSQARVIAGTLTLPCSDIQTLTNGDVIRLPSPMFDATGVGRLFVAGLAFQVRWRDADSSFEVQDVMQHDTPSSTHPSHTSGTVDPARLPVQLSFVIGTLDLTLGALAAARSGTLLRLAEGLPPTVRIEANGVPVGYGELVDLDGRLAVEITQWHGTSGNCTLP